jgi:hypothetical protein
MQARAAETRHMTTILDKELKRQIHVDGADYTVVLDPQGMRLVAKGKRRPQVELLWSDLLSGEAAMAVALNASLSADQGGRAALGAKRATKDSKPPAKKQER